MIRGSALVTTVLESMATNIASSSPLSASITSRCVICPVCSAGTASVTSARFMITRRLLWSTIFPMVAIGNFM